MPIQVLMPALSPTMTEGNLAKWHKKEGDTVKAGDILAEIETDKATMEFEAVDEGTLGRILVPEGTKGVLVNQPIAVILGEGENAGDIGHNGRHRRQAPRRARAGRSQTRARAPAAQSAAKPMTPARPIAVAPAPDAAPVPTMPPRARSARNAAPARGPAFARRVFVSPLARRLAEKSNIDLSRLVRQRPAWPHRQGRCRGGDDARARRHRRSRHIPRPRSWPKRATSPSPRCRTPTCAASSPSA